MFYEESLQYTISLEIRKNIDACLAITGAVRGTSKRKLYEELGLESLEIDVALGNYVPLL